MSALTTRILHSTGSSGHYSKQDKQIKDIQDRKEEINLFLFADDTVIYAENSKDSTKKFLELMSEFRKVIGYKINTDLSEVFVHANNEKADTKIENEKPFTIAPEKTDYLGIHLTKGVQDLYAENYKILIN